MFELHAIVEPVSDRAEQSIAIEQSLFGDELLLVTQPRGRICAC
jgi:hypothetical protein